MVLQVDTVDVIDFECPYIYEDHTTIVPRDFGT